MKLSFSIFAMAPRVYPLGWPNVFESTVKLETIGRLFDFARHSHGEILFTVRCEKGKGATAGEMAS